MKKIIITVFTLIVFVNSYSQKKGESEIIVTLSDTVMIYEKITNAFKKSGFFMKDEYKKDTLMTKANSIFNPSGYAVIRAIISGNTVTLNGWYKSQHYGAMYETNKESPNLKNYNRIIYFKNSSSWRLMNKVAEDLKNDEFKKEVFKNDKTNKNKQQSTQPGKSKEIRLRELKDLLEKELITKEDYERAKQKILDEQ
jgi:hypothetical protein